MRARIYRASIGNRGYYAVRKRQRLAGLEYVSASDMGDV